MRYFTLLLGLSVVTLSFAVGCSTKKDDEAALKQARAKAEKYRAEAERLRAELELDAMPARKAPLSVAVLTEHPGMPREIVERDITNRVKRWVSQADGARRIGSASMTGLSLVIVEFEDGIDRATAVKQIKRFESSDSFYLPPLAPYGHWCSLLTRT